MAKAYRLSNIQGHITQWQTLDKRAIAETPVNARLILSTIKGWNATLTASFWITIDSSKYEELTRITQYRKCNHCQEKAYKDVIDDDGNRSKEFFSVPSKIPVSEIRTYEERLTDSQLVLVQLSEDYATKTRKFWDCPRCSNQNNCKDSPTSKMKNDPMNTCGVIPDFPVWSLLNRSSYGKLVLLWHDMAVREISVAEVEYADEYFAQHNRSMADDYNAGFDHEDDKK
jgi:hypothetical protein